MPNKDIKIYNASLKLSYIATAIWSGTLAVLLSDIINSYSLTGTREGLMSSMISMGALAALFAFIAVQGRLKKPQIITVCGFLASIMLMIKGIPMPFTLFLIACFLMGFGHGAVDSYQSSFVADLNPGNMAKHIGSLHGIFGIGGILTPIVLQRLLTRFDWRTIYVMVGIACMVLIAQFAVVAHYMKSRVSVASRIEPKLTVAGIRKFFGERRNVFLLFCIFFGAAAQSGIIVWTIRYVSVSFGNPEIAAICLFAFWITSTVSRFYAPHLPLQPSQVLAGGAFVSALIWAAALTINLPLAILIACGLTGLMSGCCISMALGEGAAIDPNKAGFSTNILMIFKTIGQVLSPIIVAFTMSLKNMQTGMFVTSVFFVINGVFAALMIRRKGAPSQAQ